MGKFGSILKTAGAVLAESYGSAITYNSADGTSRLVLAYPVEDELRPREADGKRTVARRLVVRIAKRDLPLVTLKSDTVSGVPAEWIGQAGADVSLMVKSYAEGSESAEGMYSLVLVKAAGVTA